MALASIHVAITIKMVEIKARVKHSFKSSALSAQNKFLISIAITQRIDNMKITSHPRI